MITKGKIIEDHKSSWEKIKSELSYDIGYVPHFNFSEYIRVPGDMLPISDSVYEYDFDHTLNVDFHSIITKLYSIGVPLVGIKEHVQDKIFSSGKRYEADDFNLSYLIMGSSGSFLDMDKTSEKDVYDIIYKMNLENVFRKLNPIFYYIIDYPEFHDSSLTGNGEILEKFIENKINVKNRDFNELSLIYFSYAENAVNYILYNTHPDYKLNLEEGHHKKFDYWSEEKGLEYLMINPWKVMESISEEYILMQDLQKNMKIYTLKIDGKWAKSELLN
jgi:hypothetical protein